MKENEIDSILKSLDNVTRATAPEGFKERLFQRIDKKNLQTSPWYFQLKYGVAAMIALMLINGYILFQSNLLLDQEEITIESLANEWYLESDLIEYEYEIE